MLFLMGALGVWAGLGREPTGKVDLLLTSLMVGTTLGVVGRTLWVAGWMRGL